MEPYKTGEIIALIAPVMGMDADEIVHVCIMISTSDGKIRMAGCEHQVGLVLVGYEHVHNAVPFNPSTDNNAGIKEAFRKPRKNWLDRFLS